MKKFMIIFTILILIASVGIFSFYYFGYYEDGDMSGKVMRISQKGVIFKTYEGKINLESFGALRGASPVQEVFDFSVDKKNQKVIQELKEVALTGERVNLHYVKRYAKFFWRGDTKYFVVSVQRNPKETPNSQ